MNELLGRPDLLGNYGPSVRPHTNLLLLFGRRHLVWRDDLGSSGIISDHLGSSGSLAGASEALATLAFPAVSKIESGLPIAETIRKLILTIMARFKPF